MRKLIDVPNIEAATPDYPNGRVRDKVGAVVGTTLTEILNGDSIQFFQKLIIDAGITENDTPDNDSNGYQLIDALVDKINKTGVQRSTSVTGLVATATSSEQDFLTVTPSALVGFDDIKVNVSLSAGYVGGTTITLTTKLYVNGVEKHSISLNGSVNFDKSISFCLSGFAYSATDIVKVTVKTSSGTVNVGAGSLVVEGINN